MTQLYWPQTTVPYGEDTALAAAKVYAGAITGWQEIFKKKDDLLRRAAELLNTINIEFILPADLRKGVNQWVKDAGLSDAVEEGQVEGDYQFEHPRNES